MSQENSPINVNAFDLDVEITRRQKIEASTPITVEDSQYIANQTAAPSSALLLPFQFLVPT